MKLTLKNRVVRLFLVLSAADMLLTLWLLSSKAGRVYESNPVANWWLEAFGWAGLAGFKAATMLLAGAAVAVLARRRPRAARGVLTFGCAALALVVGYSSALAAFVQPTPEDRRETAALEEGEVLKERARDLHNHLVMQSRLCKQVLAGECTLDEAVARLEQSPVTRDPRWLRNWRRELPGRTVKEYVREALVRYIQELRADSVADDRYEANRPSGNRLLLFTGG
jgi:hypothetical protein